MVNEMAPFRGITEDSVIHTRKMVGGLGFLAFEIFSMYFGTDGHPDPRLFGQNMYILHGIFWIFWGGVFFWAGLETTRKPRTAGDR